MKFSRLALVAVFAAAAWSQTADTTTPQEQAGPTILSRADMQLPPDGTQGGEGRNFANFFLFARAFYNTSAGIFDSGNSLNNYSSSGGYDLGGGLNLAHNFKRGLLAVSYTGGYRGYSTAGANSSGYQNLAVSLNYHLNKKWLLALRESVQVLPQGLIAVPTSVGGLVPVNINAVASKQQFYVSSATLTYQKSVRWSYEMGGDFFYSSFQPSSFFNSHGYGATGSVNYRQTARTTYGVGYQYNYFTFSGGIGHSNTNTVFGSLSHTFAPGLQLGVSAGASRTQFDQLISSPTLGLVDFQRTSYSPFVNARLTRERPHFSTSLTFFNGVNAGNGAYATSRSLTAGGSLGWTPNRKLGTSIQIGYSRLNSIAGPTLDVNGATAFTYVTGSGTYKVARHVGANLSLSYFTSDTAGLTGGAHGYIALSAGLVFTSEDRPVLNF